MRAATSMPSTWHRGLGQDRRRLSFAADPTPAALRSGREVRGGGGPRSQGRARRVQRARTDPPHAALGRPRQRAIRPGQPLPAGPVPGGRPPRYRCRRPGQWRRMPRNLEQCGLHRKAHTGTGGERNRGRAGSPCSEPLPKASTLLLPTIARQSSASLTWERAPAASSPPMRTVRWASSPGLPDGRWLAFQQSISRDRSCIAVASIETGEIRAVTEPLFGDFAPSFDLEGRYLYFLSDRVLNPVYDAVQFELSFPKAVLPCLVTLRKDTPSPLPEAATDEPEAAPRIRTRQRRTARSCRSKSISTGSRAASWRSRCPRAATGPSRA